MKAIGIVSTAALSLILGIAAPLYAQEQHEEQKDKQEEKGKPAKAEEKHAQQEEKKGQQEKPAQREAKQAQQEKSNQHEEQQAQKGKEQKEEHQEQQAQKGKEQKEEHHEHQAQHAGSNGRGRITEAHFHANFGREHVFVINHPVMVEGSPRFQYGGYWFGYGEPWPVGWYYTDNVYVDYIDGGYYLYNPVHPGIRISINLF